MGKALDAVCKSMQAKPTSQLSMLLASSMAEITLAATSYSKSGKKKNPSPREVIGMLSALNSSLAAAVVSDELMRRELTGDKEAKDTLRTANGFAFLTKSLMEDCDENPGDYPDTPSDDTAKQSAPFTVDLSKLHNLN